MAPVSGRESQKGTEAASIVQVAGATSVPSMSIVRSSVCATLVSFVLVSRSTVSWMKPLRVALEALRGVTCAAHCVANT